MANPALQRFMTRLVMSLPKPVLRAMSGGEAVEIGGRKLDHQFQMMAHAAKSGPKMTDFPAPVARAAAAQAFKGAAAPLEPGVIAEDFDIPAPHGALPARSYRPDNQDASAPVFVYLHMGGGVIGDLDTGHAFCSILAKGARCPVVSVDYRLAPEHKFPAGLDDSLYAYRWTRDNAGRFGAPTGIAAIGGDSMGGNFSAIIAQDLKKAGEPQPVLQLLLYPATDVASETQSMTTYADAFPLTRETMEWFMGHYVPEGIDYADVRLSPMKEPDLSGLAPAIVVTAGFDPLCDQGEVYAHKLLEAGVPAFYRCYDSLAHGFIGFTGLVKAADIAAREIAGMVRQGFDGKLAECTRMQALTPAP
jgi:acetyl esterase/lipase